MHNQMNWPGFKVKEKSNYGPYFDLLSTPEQRAVEKYIRKLAKYYPDLAQEATAGPGNEGAVYVYIPRPSDDEEYMKIVHKSSKIWFDIYDDTGVDILLRRASREG
jgi:hypothetical protein